MLTMIVGTFAAPFLLANPGSISSIEPTIDVGRDSVLELLSITPGNTPDLYRLVQLGICVVGATYCVATLRLPSVLLTGIALRILLDPGTWGYYTAGLVAAALLFDVLGTTHVIPWTTMLAAVCVDPPAHLIGTPTTGRSYDCWAASP